MTAVAEYRVGDLPDDLAAHIVVNPVTGCWEWQLGLNPKGYGFIYRNRRNRRVHCLVYSMLAGPIPAGLDLDHVWDWGCRSKACCWPAHLEPVTRAENSRRNVRVMTVLRRQRRDERARAGETARSMTEVRTGWRDLLDEVQADPEAAIRISRYDRPVAVVVSAAWYERAIMNGEQR
jgi:hypothetical protein